MKGLICIILLIIYKVQSQCNVINTCAVCINNKRCSWIFQTQHLSATCEKKTENIRSSIKYMSQSACAKFEETKGKREYLCMYVKFSNIFLQFKS